MKPGMWNVGAAALWLCAAGCHPAADEAVGSQAIRDAAVSSAVQSKLTADRTANFARVDVDSAGGVVTLSGTVRSAEERARAERLAGQVNGVARVHNYLQIRRAAETTGQLHE